MTTASTVPDVLICGKIVEAEVKITTDPGRPLPLACALYAIESPEGTWLCAYYGTNRSNFDSLPQKGSEIDERTLGIVFYRREFVPKGEGQAARWEQFKQAHLEIFDAA